MDLTTVSFFVIVVAISLAKACEICMRCLRTSDHLINGGFEEIILDLQRSGIRTVPAVRLPKAYVPSCAPANVAQVLQPDGREDFVAVEIQ